MSSDGALAAKARAMFGARLKEEDYISLMEKKSVPEIAYTLKHDSPFSTVLEDVNDKAVHRGQLESLVRMDIFRRLRKLSRYTDSDGRKFISVGVMDTEAQMILICIRSFMQDDPEIRESMITSMPLYIEQYLSFDIRKLSDVNSFDELLEVLKGTQYEKIIRRYRADTMEEIDYVGLDHELKNSMYETVLDMIEKYTRGSAEEEMKRIFLARVELDNLAVIYRLKKYFNTSPDKIRSLMTRRYCMFHPNEIDDLIDNCSADEVVERLQKKYHRYASGIRFTDIETFTGRIRFNMNYNFIEYYTEPSLVLLAYMLLSQTEIQNVINIIEGVRYGVGIDRIRTLLIY